jgi:L-threonylcarbamoyladenylate synthase
MLAADALDEAAVRRVIAIKRRAPEMGITVIVPGLSAAESLVEVNDAALRLAERFLPGPLTLVLPKKGAVSDLLTGGRPTLGVRVPDHAFSLALAERAGRPITATSANVSGKEAAHTLTEALRQLSHEAIDLAIDGGRVATPGASTIVDLSGEAPVILREGPISESAIMEALS